ncbi:hypothetical protein N7491_008232 [Penicillium cf. griseofulvum]|uniref:Uncharacterized protein n=1 Tax=Penicillium cf. griseofulvum TaxID=2972120 RepID=A0A9W9J4A0_9EURO|nr:hypothetical protein N7472_008737 [Penicillium cf. griseofulvum]KAJ5427790.1 hypothetical protein N7491_008232 [Penicillium cf. griseofulvum]KAJ5431992.1 hypothetical protein N7445_008490 [Penicillium cf. griseofulvum]
MSRSPPQCGNSTRPYIDSVPRTQHRGPIPMPYPYRHEPRQVPQTGYERPILGPPLASSTPLVPERGTDPRYMLSSDVYMNTQVPQALPLRSYQGSADARNPYEERIYPTTSHARDYDRHRSWAYDVESQ